ncbi:uncharacterized protein LOC143182200 [Calliopsis andreniformis]|uniref:uncharacterized protein LOC143182200 n=1 Tax=Calliopsis andreniformis TaxID=337506 RepID=UPI003FCC588A
MLFDFDTVIQPSNRYKKQNQQIYNIWHRRIYPIHSFDRSLNKTWKYRNYVYIFYFIVTFFVPLHINIYLYTYI